MCCVVEIDGMFLCSMIMAANRLQVSQQMQKHNSINAYRSKENQI